MLYKINEKCSETIRWLVRAFKPPSLLYYYVSFNHCFVRKSLKWPFSGKKEVVYRYAFLLTVMDLFRFIFSSFKLRRVNMCPWEIALTNGFHCEEWKKREWQRISLQTHTFPMWKLLKEALFKYICHIHQTTFLKCSPRAKRFSYVSACLKADLWTVIPPQRWDVCWKYCTNI